MVVVVVVAESLGDCAQCNIGCPTCGECGHVDRNIAGTDVVASELQFRDCLLSADGDVVAYGSCVGGDTAAQSLGYDRHLALGKCIRLNTLWCDITLPLKECRPEYSCQLGCNDPV